MKWLNRLNRGVVLTGAIVAGIVVYLILLAAAHRADTPAIKAAAEAYVQAEITWQMLPPAYRKDTPDMPDQELADFIQTQATAIESYYIDNEAIVQPLVKRMTESLTDQASGKGVIRRFEKTISEYDDLLFEQGRVTVKFTSQTLLEGTGIGTPLVEATYDTLILQKAEGRWEVLFAILNKPYNYIQPDIIPGDDKPVGR